MNTSVIYALAAAALFGASTPLAKLLGTEIPPVMLAGLLYLGSGIGLVLLRFIRDRGWKKSGLSVSEWPWLGGAIVFGGILGPVALMQGLTLTSGATASLMLNLEPVLTAVLAWMVFKENADRRIVVGMLAIIARGDCFVVAVRAGIQRRAILGRAPGRGVCLFVLGGGQQPYAQGFGF